MTCFGQKFLSKVKVSNFLSESIHMCTKVTLGVGTHIMCLFDLILYVPVNNSLVMSGLVFLG